MKSKHNLKSLLPLVIATALFSPVTNAENSNEYKPSIVQNIYEKAKENSNWKLAYITGKEAQIVFMTISPETNPKNEIGIETHPFDQIIFIVSGKATAIVADKTSEVKEGDLLFIPSGTTHNVINLNKDLPLKVISVYSQRDIPINAEIKTKSDSEY